MKTTSYIPRPSPTWRDFPIDLISRSPIARWAPVPLRLIVGYGFSSIKLQAVTAAGAQFGPPGFETDLLYLACLATLVLGGSGPLAIDGRSAESQITRA